MRVFLVVEPARLKTPRTAATADRTRTRLVFMLSTQDRTLGIPEPIGRSGLTTPMPECTEESTGSQFNESPEQIAVECRAKQQCMVASFLAHS